MNPKNIEDIYTLSPTQQGMFFHILANPDSGMYFAQQMCILHGKFNFFAFEQAWQKVVARHPTLRTAFVWEGLKKPIQIVHRQTTLSIIQYDWSELSPTAQEAQLQDYLQADRKRGFNLSQPPLMRLAIIRIAANTHQLIWSSHHLISDVWSDAILLKEVFTFYRAFDEGKNIELQPSRPYRDYITWLKQQDLTAAEKFWRREIQDLRIPTPLGIDENNRKLSNQEEHYAQQEVEFSLNTTEALICLAKQEHLTLNTLLMGAWALLLSHYSSNKDVVFGTVLSGRPVNLAGIDAMVGLFVNTLPARVKISAEDLLLPWLKSLQIQQINLRNYEYSPLAQVQIWSNVPKGLPLFESILVVQNSKVDISQLGTQHLKLDNIRSVASTHYPLAIVAIPGANLGLHLLYDLRRFSGVTVTKVLSHFQEIIKAMVANPDSQLGNLIKIIDDLEKKEKSLALEARRQLNASKLKSIRPQVMGL
ncbi:hypothetical protein H6G33_33870 [Calothrix sp. FACHB-1219]|uniref:condensation domain-containing protein n=1 Tax=unclassified Calothrix TaxID=2619626 RepID=UPI0016837115|nr:MULTISPECIES: condensation domain-containing protein [unclassified Calothrix]MBD2207322.1 hypothetical protein [Calothrix sp. FACHB-168]MBD2221943.1 hypothetical protein [Calothrix sp. FACHB-1219]